jgi:hypothetical protein
MSHQAIQSNAEPQGSIERVLLSDDECVQQLAALIEHRDSKRIGEIAMLIGRLAVPVE